MDKSIKQRPPVIRKEDSKQDFKAMLVNYDVADGINEHHEGVRGGQPCFVDELCDLFAWMPGNVSGWYGWASDGKGTMLDYMQVLKAKNDKSTKVMSFRQEDMDTIRNPETGKAEIKANRIFKNLAWSYSGKTWNKNFADRWKCARMSLEEEMEVMKFIRKHFYIIYTKDRRFKNIMDCFRYYHEVLGITMFNIDPWNTIKLEGNERDDIKLIDTFIEIKEFAMETDTCFQIVNHARSMTDVRTGKGKDDPYKIVTSFMQLGGSAWNIKMDQEYSIYRQERHLDLRSTKVTFLNLKQRAGEIVGVERGDYEKIDFNKFERGYYFNGFNPMLGKMDDRKAARSAKQESIFDKNAFAKDDEPFGGSKKQEGPVNKGTDDLPF
jgi:hypothetical protein